MTRTTRCIDFPPGTDALPEKVNRQRLFARCPLLELRPLLGVACVRTFGEMPLSSGNLRHTLSVIAVMWVWSRVRLCSLARIDSVRLTR